MKHHILATGALCALILTGCSSAKKVPYLQEIESLPAEVLAVTAQAPEPTFVPGDFLNITVTSPNMTAALPFNKGKYIDMEGRLSSAISINGTSHFTGDSNAEGYLVDNAGNIEMPIIGTVHVGGLTKAQVQTEIYDRIYPTYIKEKPAIDVRLVNFKVTVLGEVAHPGVVKVTSDRLNILEALASCGDLGIRGRRDNVLLIRTTGDGKREIARIDLQDKNLVSSPYFWLQQNDQIYVEPNSSAANASWQLAPGVSAGITFLGGISSLAGLVIGIINLTKN